MNINVILHVQLTEAFVSKVHIVAGVCTANILFIGIIAIYYVSFIIVFSQFILQYVCSSQIRIDRVLSNPSYRQDLQVVIQTAKYRTSAQSAHKYLLCDLLTKTCYYLENQVFEGVNTRNMSLTEKCFCQRLHGTYLLTTEILSEDICKFSSCLTDFLPNWLFCNCKINAEMISFIIFCFNLPNKGSGQNNYQ